MKRWRAHGARAAFFAKCLPGILARCYDKVRHYDPSSGIFKNGGEAGGYHA